MRAAQLLGNRRVAAPLQIFLLCVAVLLPITVFSVFALTQYAASESKRVFDTALDSARQLNHALEQDLQGRISGLRVLSLSRALAAGDFQAFYLQSQRARAILGAELQYSNAMGELVTDTATPMAAPTPVGLGEDQQRALTDGVVISQLLGEPGNWYVRISVPVSGGGPTSGVLSMYLSPGQLGQVLRQAALPEEWTLAAVGNDGRIIARSRDEARFVGAPASADLQRNAVGLEGSWHGTTADGQQVLSAYVQSSLADWRVAVGVPAAVVDGPFWSSVFWLLAIGVLGLVISIAVALFFGVELARAMGSLGELAKDPANADQRPLPYTSIKEVHAVALALSEGAKRLRLEAEARDEAEQTLKESRERLERIVQTSPVGIIEVAEGAIHFANSTAQRLLQLQLREDSTFEVPNWDRRTLAGEPLSLDTDPTVRALRGETVKEQELVLHDSEGGRAVALSVNAVPVEHSGKIVGAVSSFVDISERVGAERELQEHSDHLKTLNDTGAAIAAELELEALVQMVTDAGVELIDAEFGAFFYNTHNERGEILTLYTISGVPREHFSKFPMPRNTKVFSPTFNGDGIIRSADITQDPRYGYNDPHRGMPEGHLPVRSYLAVPVASRTGEVIGGLFFGHSAPDRFSAQHEALIAGVAGQAAVGIDNARLYEEATRARASLTDLNRSLEERIAARTAELVASNRELLEEKEQRELVEDQLRQAQKMEALGQLTGGIAHDFNNLLAIIVGSLDVLRRRVDRGQFNDMTRFLNNAMEGAQRATSLTQRLLAYARRQPLAPEVIDAKSLVVDVSELLRRTIPETIRIETVVSAGLWLTHADKSELENAIVNLAVNARDAMPEGGQLTLEASNADIDDRYVSDHPGVSTGQYVLIAVTDTGSGMTKEVAERAFDPFFTTKETGKGTGLGLSQLYGYVRQTGGHVKIYSELGAGTTVKMYLPRYTGAGATTKGSEDRASLPTGTEVVLLVEDEEGVRQASAEALKELGYSVHLAADADEALRILEAVEHVDLLFTDVVMPGMNGRQLADAALLRRPHLKVLFTSGYTRNAIVHNGVLDTGVSLLVKPFTLANLANKLRSVLEAESSSNS